MAAVSKKTIRMGHCSISKMVTVEDKTVKIGDVWMREYISGNSEPRVLLGIWDQDAETSISMEDLRRMRKFITQTILKATFNNPINV